MKKVLIITYYWPPSGGAGVQRWLKFVKYLRAFGWEPVVYTPSNPENPVEDGSLAKDIPQEIQILKTPIWEPYDLYKKFVGRKKEEKINTGFLSEKKKNGLTEKIAVWMRGNFFIPDARKYWIKPSVDFLSAYLEKNKMDVIVSTGPPHSMHLIALALKQKWNIPWLADFRDPWTNIDYYKDLMLSAAADKKHHRLEKQVLENADAVVSISKTMNKEFSDVLKDKKNTDPGKYFVITNGYDEDDLYKGDIIYDSKFSLAHLGTLVKSRNPEMLWKVLARLVKTNKDFKNDLEIKLVGKTDIEALTSIESYNLTGYLKRIDYLSHPQVIKVQQQSQVLLLLLNNTPNIKGILTGKFFEYLASGRPILCIGSETGDAAEILAETNAGISVDFSDEQKMQDSILNYYHLFKTGNLKVQSKGLKRYSRKELTGELAGCLDKIVQQKK